MVVCSLKQQDPYVLCSVKVEPLTLGEGHAVFYIWQSAQALTTPQAFQNPPHPFLTFLRGHSSWTGDKYKMHEVRLPHLFNFPTISLRDCLVWCAIDTKLSFKWEKSTPCRWRVKKKYPTQVAVNSFQACNLKAGGPGLIVLYILTFWPVN